MDGEHQLLLLAHLNVVRAAQIRKVVLPHRSNKESHISMERNEQMFKVEQNKITHSQSDFIYLGSTKAWP